MARQRTIDGGRGTSPALSHARPESMARGPSPPPLFVPDARVHGRGASRRHGGRVRMIPEVHGDSMARTRPMNYLHAEEWSKDVSESR